MISQFLLDQIQYVRIHMNLKKEILEQIMRPATCVCGASALATCFFHIKIGSYNSNSSSSSSSPSLPGFAFSSLLIITSALAAARRFGLRDPLMIKLVSTSSASIFSSNSAQSSPLSSSSLYLFLFFFDSPVDALLPSFLLFDVTTSTSLYPRDRLISALSMANFFASSSVSYSNLELSLLYLSSQS